VRKRLGGRKDLLFFSSLGGKEKGFSIILPGPRSPRGGERGKKGTQSPYQGGEREESISPLIYPLQEKEGKGMSVHSLFPGKEKGGGGRKLHSFTSWARRMQGK